MPMFLALCHEFVLGLLLEKRCPHLGHLLLQITKLLRLSGELFLVLLQPSASRLWVAAVSISGACAG
jgi:hypothetical protein